MTALYRSREDPELNARALAVLEKDKKNEANCLFDGAGGGHDSQRGVRLLLKKEPQIGRRTQASVTLQNVYPAFALESDDASQRWIAEFSALGEKLGVCVEPLPIPAS
jgi:hypothetical protein